MNIYASLRTKLFLSHLFMVLLIAGSIGTYFYIESPEKVKYLDITVG